MEDPLPNFTPRVQQAIKIAKQQAIKNRNQIVNPIHLLFGIFKVQNTFVSSLNSDTNIDIHTFFEYLDSLVPSTKNFDLSQLTYSKNFKSILRNSVEKANSFEHEYVGIEHVLIALLNDEEMGLVFKNFGLRPKNISAYIELSISNEMGDSSQAKSLEDKSFQREEAPAQNTSLSKYCINLTNLAMQNKFDDVIGRDKEISTMVEILCRRIKNNPIILGEAGVGKTALVEGLCQKIVSKEAPDILCDHNVYSLNLSNLVAGTKYRGQFEERLQELVDEIVRTDNNILFIDEIHTIIGAGGAEGGLDAANILKPLLSRGKLKCIGATTQKEFKKSIEKDQAFERRFQPIILNEPSQKNCYKILNGIINKYESFHQVAYRKNAIKSAIDLSCRYINDRNLPDKAIDILDEAGSKVKLKNFDKPLEAKKIELSLESLIEQEENTKSPEQKKIISNCIDDLFEEYQKILDDWQAKSKKTKAIVSIEDVEKIVSEKVNIPLSIISSSADEKYLNLKNNLSKDIIGQSEALNTIYNSVIRFASGLNSPGKPMGVFFFLGKTGTGKTLTAKKIAEHIFGGKNNFIRFDMGEFSESVSSSKITGSSPGYVGYEEGSSLVDAVRKNPYSVILFDEIEKAHPEVLKNLLSIMDEAKLKDNFGKVADFSNTFIILTGNLGSEIIKTSGGSVGFNQTPSKDIVFEKIKSKVESFFSPEFANRIDELIVFSDFSDESFLKIIKLQLKKLNLKLKSKNIKVSLDDSINEYCLKKLKDINLGARPIERIFNQVIEFHLSKQMLEKKVCAGDKVCFSHEGKDKIVINKI